MWLHMWQRKAPRQNGIHRNSGLCCVLALMPLFRYMHNMVQYSNTSMLLFGGYFMDVRIHSSIAIIAHSALIQGSEYTYLSDLWSFEAGINSTTQTSIGVSVTSFCVARDAQSTVVAGMEEV